MFLTSEKTGSFSKRERFLECDLEEGEASSSGTRLEALLVFLAIPAPATVYSPNIGTSVTIAMLAVFTTTVWIGGGQVQPSCLVSTGVSDGRHRRGETQDMKTATIGEKLQNGHQIDNIAAVE